MALSKEDDVWVLLAKYWSDEATPEECTQAESLLIQDRDLQAYFQKLQSVSLVQEYERTGQPVKALSELSDRIRRANAKC